MKIAKRFRWEAAHRLPFHAGGCRHLHGHSYRMQVELEGEPDAHGMLLDFHDLRGLLAPLVEAWDHATLIAETDALLRGMLEPSGLKYALLPFDTTSENLCAHVAEEVCRRLGAEGLAGRIHTVRVRLEETESSYAEAERRTSAAG